MKPKVIENLRFTGDSIFWLLEISGAFMLLTGTFVDDNPLNFVLGVAFIIGGWVQREFIHGFAVGLDQLFEIRKNTSDQPAINRLTDALEKYYVLEKRGGVRKRGRLSQ